MLSQTTIEGTCGCPEDVGFHSHHDSCSCSSPLWGGLSPSNQDPVLALLVGLDTFDMADAAAVPTILGRQLTDFLPSI